MSFRFRIRFVVLAMALCAMATASARPRLVVNIVVGGLRQSDLTRYEKNFGKGGFLRLRSNGVEFLECYADYAPTSPEAGLATFATGTIPAVHGIFSSAYFDRTSNKKLELCYNPQVKSGGMTQKGIETARTMQPFIAATLSESVLNSSEQNKVITIAHNPLSAMILTGRKGDCFWMNRDGMWVSADCYMKELPAWVHSYNDSAINRTFATEVWYSHYPRERYRNIRATDIVVSDRSDAKRTRQGEKVLDGWVNDMNYMPSGNVAILEFAKRALASMLPLHINDDCKMLNICLDVSRNVVEKYGPDSMEYEDMLYSLDASLAEFLTYLYAQHSKHEDIVVVLTSDGGVSPTQKENTDVARFNVRQFEIIMNAFLSARYGQDLWVLGYADGSLYLNHSVIYNHKKTIEEVQNEAAIFALQYRGVATAIAATAMRSAQFSKGFLSLVQNGYNPRRSGDVMMTFDVERIELDANRVAMSGSVYSYDRHIPFIVSCTGLYPKRVTDRISSDQMAPSLATLIGVERPLCSDAETLVIGSR